jgi:hypothetical protein
MIIYVFSHCIKQINKTSDLTNIVILFEFLNKKNIFFYNKFIKFLVNLPSYFFYLLINFSDHEKMDYFIGYCTCF